MNILGITRALELDDADWDLTVKLRGLTEHQREQFSAALGPLKAQKKTERVIEHCAACDYTKRAQVHKDTTVTGYHEFQPSSKKSVNGGGKSKHSESLKQQISNRAQSAIRPPSTAITDRDNNDDGNTPRCQAKRSDSRICMLLPDHNIHHLTTAMDYHPFVSTAQAAQPSSNQATSEIGKGVVSSAAQGGG